MFLQRLLVALVLLPIGLWALFYSEISFAIFMMIVFAIAGWEYIQLFQIGEYQPARFAIIGAVIFSLGSVTYFKTALPLVFVVPFILMAAAYHLWHYERGRESSVLDMTISFAGILYLGVLGSYFMAIRVLPGGDWWIFTVLTSVWWADTGAYVIGKNFGKRPLAARLSPKKTWEGYFGGIVAAIIGSPLLLKLSWILDLPVDKAITIPRVILLGAVMGVLPTLGDLTISMIKRYFKVKDTGTILAGHGGMLDRIDSWLWAVSIGYYLITLLFISI
jgi:phosphatidate cytidylyltransferase